MTIYSRGLHGEPNPDAEHVKGDRADLTPLHGREWDATIDTSGYDAETVGASAQAQRRPLRVRLAPATSIPTGRRSPSTRTRPCIRRATATARTRRTPSGVLPESSRDGARRPDRRPARQRVPPAVVGAAHRAGREGSRARRPRAADADHRRPRPLELPARPRGDQDQRRLQRHRADRADDVPGDPRGARATRTCAGSPTSNSKRRTSSPGWSCRCGSRQRSPEHGAIGTEKAQQAGLRTRPVKDTVHDVRAWLENGGERELQDWRSEHRPQRDERRARGDAIPTSVLGIRGA